MAKKKSKRQLKLTGIDIDKIAKEAGFPNRLRQLTGHGNYIIYSNEDRTLNRLYDPLTGEVVNTYPPKSRTVSLKFHNPEEVTSVNSYFMKMKWYMGKGNGAKRW